MRKSDLCGTHVTSVYSGGVFWGLRTPPRRFVRWPQEEQRQIRDTRRASPTAGLPPWPSTLRRVPMSVRFDSSPVAACASQFHGAFSIWRTILGSVWRWPFYQIDTVRFSSHSPHTYKNIHTQHHRPPAILCSLVFSANDVTTLLCCVVFLRISQNKQQTTIERGWCTKKQRSGVHDGPECVPSVSYQHLEPLLPEKTSCSKRTTPEKRPRTRPPRSNNVRSARQRTPPENLAVFSAILFVHAAAMYVYQNYRRKKHQAVTLVGCVWPRWMNPRRDFFTRFILFLSR